MGVWYKVFTAKFSERSDFFAL